MDLSVEDVKQLTFEVWLLQRELTTARAANAELHRLLEQATQPDKADH